MTDSDGTFVVSDSQQAQRFELHRDGELVGWAQYQLDDDRVIVPHVETLAAHRGNGYAARLMEGLLAIVRTEGHKIVPLCSFAAGHVADNPQHHDLVARR